MKFIQERYKIRPRDSIFIIQRSSGKGAVYDVESPKKREESNADTQLSGFLSCGSI